MDLFGRYNTSRPQVSMANYTYMERDNWEITEKSPQIEQLSNFKFPLMPYQLSSIYTMDQIETHKCFSTKTMDYHSSAAILSNAMGSGKTATVLGLLTYKPVPNYGAYYPISVNCYPNTERGRKSYSQPVNVILRTHHVALRPALIFVGYGVLSQWASEVMKFNPALRFFTVDGIHTLKKFYDILHSGKINNYDLIIIKNKTVSGTWEWKHGEMNEGIVDYKIKSIYNMISVICRNVCFTRLIVDDFDTIGVPPIAGNINAIFTWFLSSTKKTISKRVLTNTDHMSVDTFLHHNNIAYSDITKNTVLYKLFNVRVSLDYYKTYTNVGRPNFFYYKFTNPSGKVMDLINCMAGDKISEIMEALNGDAIDEAARLAGIEASDPNQIFKALLQKNYENMAVAKTVLDHFEEYFDQLDIDDLPSFADNPDQTDTYTRKDLRNRRPLEWRYPGIRSLLSEEKEKWQASFDECSACLERFKSSVKDDECLVCNCELDDEDENYAILPCCKIIIHADCAVRGCSFRKGTMDNAQTIVGRCPFDKSHIVPLEKLCYIKGGFDLSQIDESKFEEDGDAVTSAMTAQERKDRSKYDAILDIIQGINAPEQTSINLRITNLLVGREKLGDPDYLTKAPNVRNSLRELGVGAMTARHLSNWMFLNAQPRVLVFANFDETLDKIEDMLKTHGLNYARLGGTTQQINETVALFQTGVLNTLLIKSEKYCSSLNLQQATDLIFAHHIKDDNVQSQVAGRIQRTGRSCNARIHFMVYDNEIGILKTKYEAPDDAKEEPEPDDGEDEEPESDDDAKEEPEPNDDANEEPESDDDEDMRAAIAASLQR